jgi:hypothetical protein
MASLVTDSIHISFTQTQRKAIHRIMPSLSDRLLPTNKDRCSSVCPVRNLPS